MSKYFLGVDIGATKSHALIADETGQAVGFGAHGPGNHEVVGYQGLIEALNATTGQGGLWHWRLRLAGGTGTDPPGNSDAGIDGAL